jgi:chromosome segregation ATPase
MEESKESLKERVHQKERELSMKDNELYGLRQEKFKLILKLQSSSRQADRLDQQHRKLQQAQHEQQQQQIKMAKEEKEEITLKLKNATDSKELSKTMLIKREILLVSSKKELEEKKRELSSLKEHVKTLEGLKEKLVEHVGASKKKLKDSKEELEEKELELKDSKEELEEKKRELSSLKEHVKTLEDLIKRLDASKNEQAKKLEDSKKELKERIRRNKSELSSSEDRERAILVGGLEQAKILEDKLNKVVESKRQLERKLKEELEELKLELSSSKNMSTEQAKRLEQAKILEDKLNEVVESKRQLERKLKEELEELKLELSSSKNMYTEQANRLGELKKELEGANVSIQEAAKNFEELKLKLFSSKNMSTEQANRLGELKKELEGANVSIQEAAKNFEELKLELSSSMDMSTEQAKRLRELKKELEGANASIQEAAKNLKASNEELKAASARDKKIITYNNKQLEDQNIKLTGLENDLKRVNTEHQEFKQAENQKNIDLMKKLSELNDKANENETKLKTAEDKLSEEKKNNDQLRTLVEDQKVELTTRSTTLAHAIKSGRTYPLDTLTKIEKFVGIISKRFNDRSPDDDPSSFFPIEQADRSNTDLLKVLHDEQELVNLVQSDNILVTTFYELIQTSSAMEVENVNYLDTLLLFNLWVSNMIFKNLPNLFTAITKAKEGRRKRKLPIIPASVSCKQLIDQRNNLMLPPANRAHQHNNSYAMQPPANRAVTTTNKPPVDELKVRVKLTYTAKGREKEGSLITEKIGPPGEDSFTIAQLLLEEKINEDHWYAYVLKKDDESGKLFCPFCSVTYATKGFTNHTKSCTSKKNKRAKK